MDFPRYDSKKALTTDRPEPLRDEAAAQGKLVTGALDVSTDMAVKWNEKVEKVQADTALYNYKVGMLEIENEAALSTDIGAEERYQKRAKELRQNVTKGASQRVVNSLTPELDYLSSVGSLGIKKEFMKKVAIQGQAIKIADLEMLAKNPNETSLEQIKAAIADGTNSGYWDAVKAQALETEYENKMQQNRFRQDARINREEAKRKVEEGAYGFDQKQIDTALSTLEHYKNLEKKDEIQRIVDGRFDLFTAIANGKEDLYNLSDEAQAFISSDVDSSEAISKAQKANAGYYTSKKDRSFVTTIKEASEADSQEKLTNIMYSTLYRDKNVTPERLGALAYYSSQRAKTLKLSKNEVTWESFQTDPKQAKTDVCLNSLVDWAKNNNVDKEKHSNLITELLLATSQGQEPLPYYMNMIKRENLSLFPDMVNFPEEGQLMVDDKGVAVMAYPDGSIKPIEPKVTKLSEGSAEKSKGEPKKEKASLLSFDEANE